MIGTFLQFGSLGFTNVLNQLDQIGFFSYILPFLLIFALVYAILTKLDIFKDNKGAGLIVALAIGLLALQLNFVSVFFQQIFPRFGVGLSVLLCALILAGAFISGTESKAFKWIFFSLGGVIFLFVVGSSFNSMNYNVIGTGFWQEYGAIIIVLLAIVGAIIAVTSKK